MIGAQIAFAGQPLDRADHVRRDEAALRRCLENDALLLGLDGLAPEFEGEDRLLWRAAADAPAGAELVFLGLRDGRGAFAMVPEAGDAGPAYAHRPAWSEITRLSPDDLALYGSARSLVDWHARHRFCAFCGQQTVPAKGGWQRDCVACGTNHFPRVDPVAIMLVEHEAKGIRRLLLGRQSRFPARSYSALAGFVEPGETVEGAVAREVFEEAGVRVERVRYLASQPWPFPSQLMLGCIGYAADDRLTIDHSEVEDARWFTRAEVAEAIARGAESTSFLPPPQQAIAYSMLQWWLEEKE